MQVSQATDGTITIVMDSEEAQDILDDLAVGRENGDYESGVTIELVEELDGLIAPMS